MYERGPCFISLACVHSPLPTLRCPPRPPQAVARLKRVVLVPIPAPVTPPTGIYQQMSHYRYLPRSFAGAQDDGGRQGYSILIPIPIAPSGAPPDSEPDLSYQLLTNQCRRQYQCQCCSPIPLPPKSLLLFPLLSGVLFEGFSYRL